jgi:hypothetical protein
MRVSPWKTILFFVMAFCALVGCDVAFNPKDVYVDKLVIYSVLDPTKNIQFARVYVTYDVEGTNPVNNKVDTQVGGATIRLTDDQGQTYVFKDSLLKRDASDRYTSDIIAYYSYGLLPASGKRYKLEVSAPGFQKSTAEVTVPEPFVIYVNGGRFRPLLADSANECSCFQVSLYGGSGAKGSLTRFFINYTVKKPGGEEVRLSREVPIGTRKSADGRVVPVYPQPDRATYIEFPQWLFFSTMYDILQSAPGSEITATEVLFVSHAMEPALYNYYQIAHGFGDPFSVRLDQPDYTNIQNGLGVFGAVAVDSLKLLIR